MQRGQRGGRGKQDQVEGKVAAAPARKSKGSEAVSNKKTGPAASEKKGGKVAAGTPKKEGKKASGSTVAAVKVVRLGTALGKPVQQLARQHGLFLDKLVRTKLTVLQAGLEGVMREVEQKLKEGGYDCLLITYGARIDGLDKVRAWFRWKCKCLLSVQNAQWKCKALNPKPLNPRTRGYDGSANAYWKRKCSLEVQNLNP